MTLYLLPSECECAHLCAPQGREVRRCSQSVKELILPTLPMEHSYALPESECKGRNFLWNSKALTLFFHHSKRKSVK